VTFGEILVILAIKSGYFHINAKEFMTLINSDYVYEAVNDSYCFAHKKNAKRLLVKLQPIFGVRKYLIK